MAKFICEECDGMCELTINCSDLEGPFPYRCQSTDYIQSEWVCKDKREDKE